MDGVDRTGEIQIRSGDFIDGVAIEPLGSVGPRNRISAEEYQRLPLANAEIGGLHY